MNQIKLTKTLSALLLTFCAANNAQAVPLSDLFGGQTLTAADKLFDKWVLFFPTPDNNGASDPAFNFDYSHIDVTALNDGGNNPGPGINIDFGDQMGVTGDGTYAYKDLTIGFHVSTLGDELIKDNTLTFSSGGLGWSTDGSNDLGVAVEEWVTDAFGSELAHKYIEFSLLDDQQTTNFPDHADFILPQGVKGVDEIFVKKNFLVWSRDQTDTATLNGVQQRFSQVPEPATLALYGVGLMGFFISVKRRKSLHG